MKRRSVLAVFGASLVGLARPVGAAQVLPMLGDGGAASADSASKGRPLVLFFTLPGCRFCEHLRQHYMLPLARRGELVKEVVIDSDARVVGWPNGETQRDIARAMHVKFAPVVILVDARGRALAEPIVGGDISGMYGGYLDNAFEEAQRRLSR